MASEIPDPGEHRPAVRAAVELVAAGAVLPAPLAEAAMDELMDGSAPATQVAALLAMSRVSRIAPVSREMILSFVAQHDLQLPRSY